MARYIDATQLEAILKERTEQLTEYVGNLAGAAHGALLLVQAQPTVEVAPVVQGMWQRDRYGTPYCGNCGEHVAFAVGHLFRCGAYCPCCGAHMWAEE